MGNGTSSEEKFNEEDIGIALFEKVHSFHKENAEKITGMLLEMPQKDLETVLTDDNKLMSRIYDAIKILNYESELAKRDSLGDILYPEVEAVYSEHEVAEKITGMLLEMKVEDIEKLIEDKNGLLVKIHEAADVLQRHKNNEHCDSQAIEESPPSRLELGDKIFESILRWYPDEETAAKLAGMLLEMNLDEVKKLAEEDKLLKCKADEAYRVLKNQT